MVMARALVSSVLAWVRYSEMPGRYSVWYLSGGWGRVCWIDLVAFWRGFLSGARLNENSFSVFRVTMRWCH